MMLSLCACTGAKTPETGKTPSTDADASAQAEQSVTEWSRGGYFQDENENMLSVTRFHDGNVRLSSEAQVLEEIVSGAVVRFRRFQQDIPVRLTVAEENVPAFRKALSEYYRANVPTPPVPTLNIDLEVLKPALLSFKNVSALALLEPYGNGHPSPSLCIMDSVLASVTAIGGGNHVKLRVAFGGETFECIFFSHSPESLGVNAGDRVDIAFSPQINDFRGRQSIQLMLIDIRPHTGDGN